MRLRRDLGHYEWRWGDLRRNDAGLGDVETDLLHLRLPCELRAKLKSVAGSPKKCEILLKTTLLPLFTVMLFFPFYFRERKGGREEGGREEGEKEEGGKGGGEEKGRREVLCLTGTNLNSE